MKKILSTLLVLIFISSAPGSSDYDYNGSSGCGTYNGHSLYKGPKGGCYYFNSKGNKVYVDRSLCKC